jgi:hypothetical protein
MTDKDIIRSLVDAAGHYMATEAECRPEGVDPRMEVESAFVDLLATVEEAMEYLKDYDDAD